MAGAAPDTVPQLNSLLSFAGPRGHGRIKRQTELEGVARRAGYRNEEDLLDDIS